MRRLCSRRNSYDGRNGELVFLCVFEQSQDIVTNDDTLLSRKNVLDTHVDDFLVGLWRFDLKKLLAVADETRPVLDEQR